MLKMHPPLSIATISLAQGFTDRYYNQTLSTKGGSGLNTWSIIGEMPPGLSIYGNSLQGVPIQAGNFSFRLQVDDGFGQVTSSKLLTLKIIGHLEITSMALPAGDATASYNFVLQATGGVSPYTWSKSGSWPEGLTLSSGGIIKGKPKMAGDFNNLSVTVKDKLKTINTAIFSLHINTAIILSADSLPPGEVYLVYPTWTPSASGGDGNFTWSYSGKFPAGLSFDENTGVISGIPTAAVNNTAITVKVKDTLGGSASKKLVP